MIQNLKECRAYANGALDGYSHGNYENPYNPETCSEEHLAYKLGYDYGVALFAHEESGVDYP